MAVIVPLSWPKRVKNGILRASNYQEWFNILAKSGFISKYTNYSEYADRCGKIAVSFPLPQQQSWSIVNDVVRQWLVFLGIIVCI